MTNLNTRVRAKGALFTNYYLACTSLAIRTTCCCDSAALFTGRRLNKIGCPSDPLCSPSRAAILTGTFPHNHGLTDNSRLNTSTFHPLAEARTVNVWLQHAGYDTMLAGKYMNGYHANGPNKWARYVPPGWSSFYGFQTVDFFGTAVNINGVTKVYPKDNYQTDIIANISLAWMRQTHDKTKPFFMFLTPHAPHAPYTPAPRHKGTLAGLKQPQDPAFNLPDALQQLLPGNLAHLPVVNASQMDSIYESRAEALLAIDEMIGHLLDEVTALNVEDNTYFFFTCDST
jgi:N-acetylglucosamine-6-sulfatase|eukprot:COSAG02_NODE_326_length_24603_cov_123.455681_9_plen_286_part_00